MTNSNFAFGFESVKPNGAFLKACKKANIKPSTKQASKYRNGKGIAFKFRKHPTTKYLLRQVAVNKGL